MIRYQGAVSETGYRGTPKERRALGAYVKLARAASAVEQAVNRPLADEELTTSQFGVLEALLHLGPLPQGTLARKILTSPANLSHVLDQLEARDRIVRTRDPNDRRVVLVDLTAEGRAFITDLFPRHVDRVVAAFASLDPDEQAELARLLRTLGHAQTGPSTATRQEPRESRIVPEQEPA